MSFFESMKRMIEGRPVFEATDDHNTTSPPNDQKPVLPLSTPLPEGPAIRKGDANSFPVVYVKRTTTHFNGNNMQVYCHIINTWPEEIMLDKMRFAETTRELDVYLRGGEEREFLVYSGPKLQKQYYEAQLDYKTREERDYFEAVHDVRCTYRSEDKTYEVDEMHLRRPIRDIYG